MDCVVLSLQSALSAEETVIFVVSTTGQGETPDSMKVGILCVIVVLILIFFKWYLF